MTTTENVINDVGAKCEKPNQQRVGSPVKGNTTYAKFSELTAKDDFNYRAFNNSDTATILPAETAGEQKCSTGFLKKFWYVLSRVFHLLAIISFIVALLLVAKFKNIEEDFSFLKQKLRTLQTSDESIQNEFQKISAIHQTMHSCKELKAHGHSTDGVYSIKPSLNLPPFDVYCDMTSGGGGWTLVAAVHENDIDGKCTQGDMWSSELGLKWNYVDEIGNWENYRTFGNIESVTTADYKNSAYSNLMAKDIMVWHVPNNLKINDIDGKAFLKYYTENNFLNDYENNLRTFFSKYAKMEYDKSVNQTTHKPFAFPVVFAKGNTSDVESRVTYMQKNYVTSGYIQLRAYDKDGLPYALCPGVKMENQGDPSLNCVGGVNSHQALRGSKCGDFTGWEGTRHYYRYWILEYYTKSIAKSAEDIDSSILIFTR